MPPERNRPAEKLDGAARTTGGKSKAILRHATDARAAQEILACGCPPRFLVANRAARRAARRRGVNPDLTPITVAEHADGCRLVLGTRGLS